MKKLKDLKAELRANPAVRQAYDVQAPEFELTRELWAAMREVSALVDKDPSPHKPEGERLNALSALIEDYERKHHPIDMQDPVEANKFHMDQGNDTLAPQI